MWGSHRIGRKAAEYTDDDDEPLFKWRKTKDNDEPLVKTKDDDEPRKPSALDKAMEKIKKGRTEVSLVRTPIEIGMDEKLAALIEYVRMHPHVVSVELQAIVFISYGMYFSDNR